MGDGARATDQFRAEWEHIFEAIGHPVIILDSQRRVLAANRATLKALGASEADLKGRNCYEVFHRGAPGPPPECPMHKLLGSDHVETAEMEVEALGGVFLVSCTPVFDDRGRLDKVIHVATDITDRRRAEAERARLAQQLDQARRMEAVGRLAGGVAHDFNNLLTVITGNAEVALAAAREGEPAKPALEEALVQIAVAAQRGGALTRQLLTFSRRDMPCRQVLDPNKVVAGLEPMLRRLIGEHIEIELGLAPDVGRVHAGKSQLEQVLMNLVLNARDAMPAGGKLSIRTANAVLDDEYVRHHVEPKAGPHVMLAVADTGQGMSDETLQHVFEPFFTTKPVDRGSGLGLATVYGIVKESGGHITVSSHPGTGSVFSVYLPAVEEAETPAEDPSARRSASGHETVLLCEDEEMVRAIARTALLKAGYRVLEAAAGGQALERAAAHDGPIDLLITDLVMPGMNGRDLAAALRQTRPDLRVVVVSGYSSGVVDEAVLAAERLEFLAKPFQLCELLHRVREVLDRPMS